MIKRCSCGSVTRPLQNYCFCRKIKIFLTNRISKLCAWLTTKVLSSMLYGKAVLINSFVVNYSSNVGRLRHWTIYITINYKVSGIIESFLDQHVKFFWYIDGLNISRLMISILLQSKFLRLAVWRKRQWYFLTDAFMFISMKYVTRTITTALITSWAVRTDMRTSTVILDTLVDI